MNSAQYSAVSAITLRIAYGIEVTNAKDPYLLLEERAHHAFEKAFVPGKYIVSIFPFLRHLPTWFPGAKFRHDAAEFAKVFDEMRNKPFDAVLAIQASLTVIISGFAYLM